MYRSKAEVMLTVLTEYNVSKAVAGANFVGWVNFYPPIFKGCVVIVFTHGFRMDGWAAKFVQALSQKL